MIDKGWKKKKDIYLRSDVTGRKQDEVKTKLDVKGKIDVYDWLTWRKKDKSVYTKTKPGLTRKDCKRKEAGKT